MNGRAFIGAVCALALAVAIVVTGPAHAQSGGGGYGRGMMGPSMMGPGMMGPGMIGPCGYGTMGGYGPGMMGGYGPGMTGRSYAPQQTKLNLSAQDVKSYLDRWIAATGNPHIKAGPVTEKNPSTITADIVTADKDALVQRFTVNRQTGVWLPAK